MKVTIHEDWDRSGKNYDELMVFDMEMDILPSRGDRLVFNPIDEGNPCRVTEVRYYYENLKLDNITIFVSY